ncbi:NTP pyrophosphatase (non-canonical NTP hydrolase) [Desulfosalsimonas propionicica]|uniref:NTP pyrophosphatase (Non-canonical NTP hydrolase) n=1 Tax=Desulfosalsimonas propionicica TaxID=332175 RepID=A0A7W0CCG0_9BACT|nr:nucleotide pyrophosphohydrolase [Desulfosalsimonas propionicica]MBA2883213.1 NTP pyrophosphatase (non-canonical NTP hydrolase) [Desulfosalsimonas propionicica]
MESLKQKLREFAKARDWEQFHSPKNLVMALNVEVAELMEHFQWLTQDRSRNLDVETRKKVRQEIGDVMVYLVRLADELGVDPVAAAEEKISVNEAKYPAEKVRGSSRKYNEYE